MNSTSSHRPILVTGSHRSGTTWVGRTLAIAAGVSYVHEPFNIDLRRGAIPPLPHWYQYIDSANAAGFERPIANLFAGRYPLLRNLRSARTLREVRQVIADAHTVKAARRPGHRLLVKDPLALFSAEWLCDRFDCRVVVMIRHPAAFAASLKIKNWQFDFAHLAAQPLLLENYLARLADDVVDFARNPRDILAQAALLWNCTHTVIDVYRQRHPDWTFIRHEDLSREPAAKFRQLFSDLGLDFSAAAAAHVDSTSGRQNPVEPGAGDEFARDSRGNVQNWKNRLAPAEIERVREGTALVAPLFYSDAEW